MFGLDGAQWATIIVSLIVAASGWATSRNAARAARNNVVVTSGTEIEKARLAAETEAYNRARKMDIETIERQKTELKELREQNEKIIAQNEHLNEDVKRVAKDNEELHREMSGLKDENRELRVKVARLEGYPTAEREEHEADERIIAAQLELPPGTDDSVDFTGAGPQ